MMFINLAQYLEAWRIEGVEGFCMPFFRLFPLEARIVRVVYFFVLFHQSLINPVT